MKCQMPGHGELSDSGLGSITNSEHLLMNCNYNKYQ